MSVIGTLTSKGSGYSLKIRTITQKIDADLRAVESKRNDSAPDFRIFLKDQTEIGAAWNRTSDKAEYLSISLDDPFLQTALKANSYKREDGIIVLLWTRS